MTTVHPRLRAFVVSVLFLVGAAHVVTAQQVDLRATAIASASEPFVLPFELASNKLYMATMVNGKGPYPFVLDTGAPMTVLDWDLAESIEIKIWHTGEAAGAGEGTIKMGSASGVRTTVGPVRYQPRRIEVMPLNRTLSLAEGRDVMGLLGGDVLERFVSEFDFEAKEVRLHPRAYEYDGKGERIPLTIDGHVLARAVVLIDGRLPINGRFIIDTGARIAVSLSTHVVNENRLLGDDIKHISTTVGWGVGGPLEHGLTRAASLSIGNVTFDAPTVTLSKDTRGIFTDRRISGVIGTEVLKRCRVTLDYGREQMYLEPIEAAMKRPFPADAAGLFITAGGPEHRVYTVRTVVTQSPASEAGIAPGDVIDRVGGGPALRYSLEELRELFREPGKTFEVELMRGQERRPIKLTTRSLI